ncbi:sigma-54-dependent transcriptional regulator [Haliangium ochraceum]|uniref:Two component, sigma54 specific, transcriptional regulator, Fis family n=1 Tax=Haliangium ochraceum (strain DSM 14365 / JCM 11303 / SMP-2) TaxID=502025 RepID=D0LTW0_HALO1|nr:sigma-54 dependent transcriptional regulator [Haliangium ochraceum]ACY15804.1 two component, sigma54 specific, transcriptional regulator, Fis family [Haliangium ochraceum DSM 14365]
MSSAGDTLASAPERVREQFTVLVVEDDDAMRDVLQEELGDAGFRVQVAAGARAGIEQVRAGPVDMVITDLRMPDLDGFDLIRDINATDSPPPIIMVTAFGSIDTAIKAVKLGAHDYITKPFEIDELVLVIDKALAERALRRRVDRLQREVESRYGFDNIIAHSSEMRELLSLVSRVATSTASVLLTGESGTGKELVARAIHYNSPRAEGAFVAVNLAAVPEALVESELFGHTKGAFTDARQSKAGLFNEADGGTIFLDEIAEMAAPLQAKLLRALQEQEIRPVGATRPQRVDVRVVAATNRDLQERMAEGDFREDLYYRLNVIQIELPPLRRRPDDILPLAEHFLALASARLTPPRSVRLAAETQRILHSYPWPGNVRELANVIERGLTLCRGDLIAPEDLPNHVRERKSNDFLSAAVARRMNLAQLEREFIERILKEEGGNKTRTAQRLGLDRKTLYRKLDEYARADKRDD